MKRSILYLMMVATILLSAPIGALAQAPTSNVVNMQYLKTKSPENGTPSARDSLIAIYNDNVVKKNDKIISHREYAHFFTANSKDYLIIEEYKDLASMEEAFTMSTELEKKAWPDATQRKAFFDAMEAYFEEWHGDALYHMNPKLSKN